MSTSCRLTVQIWQLQPFISQLLTWTSDKTVHKGSRKWESIAHRRGGRDRNDLCPNIPFKVITMKTDC